MATEYNTNVIHMEMEGLGDGKTSREVISQILILSWKLEPSAPT